MTDFVWEYLRNGRRKRSIKIYLRYLNRYVKVQSFTINRSKFTRGATEDDFSGQFFIFEIIIFCFVVAICDLVHDVETEFHLSYVLTASGNLLLKYE